MNDLRRNDSGEVDEYGAACFTQVASGIYRRVVPEVVWPALQYALDEQLPSKDPTIMIMFVRIAEYYPSVREHLAEQLCDARQSERLALQLILDPPEGIRNAEYLPDEVLSPGEMDLCWCEFLVTGSTKPIEKVVAVLDREDLSRATIDAWLSGEQSPALAVDDSLLAELASAGISVGHPDSTWQIMSPGDVDILIWFGVKAEVPACVAILQQMSEVQRLHLACKGAAVWSLRANAAQHGSIRLFCEQHATQAGGRGRLLIDPAT